MPENIADDRIDSQGSERFSPASIKPKVFPRLQSGDIVCSRRGDIHRRALVTPDKSGWLCGSGCFQIRTGKNLDSKFLFYYLAHPDVKAWISQRATGAIMPHVNIETYTLLPVLVPPLEEQRRIASTLSLLDEKIVLNHDMNDELDRCAHESIKEEVPLADDSQPGPGQTVTTLGKICKLENGRTPVRGIPEYWTPATIPWLNSKEIRQPVIFKTQNAISLQGLKKSFMKIWPKNTIVISLFGEVAGNISILGLDACANQSCCGLLTDGELYPYVFFYLRLMKHQLSRLKNGTSMQCLNQHTIAELPIVMPARQELAALSLRLRLLLERIHLNMSEIDSLSAIRDQILPDLVTGVLPIKNETLSSVAAHARNKSQTIE